MLPTLKDNGDPLERAFADFLAERLPAYERMWSRFIGNDGSSRLLSRKFLTPREQEQLERTAQWTYTAVEALLCASFIKGRVDAEQIGSVSPVDRTTQYLSAVTDLVSFYAHVGRVRDAFVALSKLWKDVGLCESLAEYYQQRNTVLHDVKLPFKFDGSILHVVEPEGTNHNPSRWGRDRLWSQADAMSLTAVPELME